MGKGRDIGELVEHIFFPILVVYQGKRDRCICSNSDFNLFPCICFFFLLFQSTGTIVYKTSGEYLPATYLIFFSSSNNIIYFSSKNNTYQLFISTKKGLHYLSSNWSDKWDICKGYKNMFISQPVTNHDMETNRINPANNPTSWGVLYSLRIKLQFVLVNLNTSHFIQQEKKRASKYLSILGLHLSPWEHLQQ